ncbi:protein TRANSPARENT TESTA 9-like isoform X2 [Diospyros lotus]|uniref:protein TRANSPARENT TESTA 9-like isoform X2 n=1 Tax=Diospyros lotus TaxID=55363 RepID=UPI00224DC510|nr:protein TRANSPARENT TESTA 9-like isoform X2 [Diospyros lotus]
MWRALWRSVDRFSLQHFKCFMEYQVLGEFVRVLKIRGNCRIEAPLLQYLSILIQNMNSEYAIYYCLSNDYINSVILHQYEFDGTDLAPYYVSFLRAVSSKLNKDTLCLLVKVHEDTVVSFPLYTEALKFSNHGEKMVQTAIRALILNIYNVNDELVYQFLTTTPVSQYFSDLVLGIEARCRHLDVLVHAAEENCSHGRTTELLLETDKIVDDLYYLNDILSVGDSRLTKIVTQSVFSLLVFPMLLQLLQLDQNNGTCISSLTSLCVVGCLLQVVHGENMVNFVASAILYADVFASTEDATKEVTNDGTTQSSSFSNPLDDVVYLEPECAGNFKINHHIGCLSEYLSFDSHFGSFPFDDMPKGRVGILQYIFSENQCLILASLMLLLILAESKDLDYRLAGLIGFYQTKIRIQNVIRHDLPNSQDFGGRIFVKHLSQIIHVLLKVLASQSPSSVVIQWHIGWFLRKLLVFKEKKLDNHDISIFNMSYEQSCKSLWEELDGCWFDYIPDTLRNEWTSCKRVLDESSQYKDPFFALEHAYHQDPSCGATSSALAWQRMVDTVKVFVLHIHLKAFIFDGDSFDNPFINLKSSSSPISGRNCVSDLSSASFGSVISLGSGIACKISFPKVGMRDIYVIPIATGTSGKLLFLERHPLHSKRGVVIAIAPLAGLNPEMDDSHPTWLHLQIREFNPRFDQSKTRSHLKTSTVGEDARWTVGFPDAKSCEAARLLILEETIKQRAAVESLLAPLLPARSQCAANNPQGQGE